MKINLWLVLILPAFLVALMVLSVWSDIREFDAKRPFLEANGEIAKLECNNHGQYQVRFNVDRQAITSGPGNPFLRADCGALAVGQKVTVWYSAYDPNYASFIAPARALTHMKGEIFTSVFFGYPFMVGFLILAMRFQKNRN